MAAAYTMGDALRKRAIGTATTPNESSPAWSQSSSGSPMAIPQAHASATAAARRSLLQELQPRLVQGRNELHEGVDRPTYHALTALHALDRRHRQPRPFSERALVDPQEGPCRLELARSNHG